MNNWVSRVFNNLNVKATKHGGSYFYTFGSPVDGSFWGERPYDNYLLDFIQIPELNTAINYRAGLEASLKMELVSKKDEKPTTSRDQLIQVIKKPNWFQTFREWYKSTAINRMIYGNEYIWTLAPVGSPERVKAIYNLPPQTVWIRTTEKKYFLNPDMPEDVKYIYRYPDDKEGMPLSKENLLHLNDNRADYKVDDKNSKGEERKNYLYGTSKLASLSPVLENLRTVHEGRNTLRNVPVKIIGNDAKDVAGYQPMQKEEKELLQTELRKYSLKRKGYQYIISDAAIKTTDAMPDVRKMMLYEETAEDSRKIYNVFGIPPEIFDPNTTYENKQQAERNFIQNTIIPATEERIEALNDKLLFNKSYKIKASFDHLPVLQENLKERGDALTSVVNAMSRALADGAITLEDYKRELEKFKI